MKAEIFACAALVALAAAPAGAQSRFDLPQGPGRDLVYGHCQTCHDLQSVEDSAGIRRGAWDAVLDNMRNFGLRVTDDQRAQILDYLATYLGPEPPPQQEVAPADQMASADGKEVFDNTCVACHQEDGKGKPEQFPPLAGNHDLFLSREFPALVALNGLQGKLTVEGQKFDNVMPPFDFLSDAEIAAVIAYVRSNWGNDELAPGDMKPLDAATVAELRKTPLEPAEVHDRRQSLLQE